MVGAEYGYLAGIFLHLDECDMSGHIYARSRGSGTFCHVKMSISGSAD